jgi:hypothetical protein
MSLDQAALPFTGRTAHSRHASYTGAVVAGKSRGVKTQLYLQWLRRYGPATDHSAHDATGLPLATINSIRNTLVTAGLVGSAGITHGVEGARRTLWRVQEVSP